MRQLGGVTGATLAPLLGGDLHRPRLTWYGADGARVELSTASLANWAAKVAGLLTDELGAVPGDRVAVLLPTFWQTAPVLLGAWWAGLVVTDVDDPGAAVGFVPEGGDAGAEEVFVVSGHPLGAPARQIATHQRDFTGAVLPQGDRFGGIAVDTDDLALSGSVELTVGEVLERSRVWQPGARVLSALAWTLPDPAVELVVGTLAADGSLVQVVEGAEAAEHDLSRIGTAEKVTVTATL
jgi:uncharacterized protein (TIGR03089 family)